MTDLTRIEPAKLTRLDEWNDQLRIMRMMLEEAGPIETDAQEMDAADRAKEVHLLLKEIEAARKEATAPLDKLKRQIMDQARPLTTEAESLKNHWKAKLSAYAREKERKAAEYRREQERIAAEQARLAEQAAEEGADVDFEHHVQRAEDAEAMAHAADKIMAPKTTGQSFGRATKTKRWTFKIVDPSAVPREWLTLDEKRVKLAAKMDPRPDIPGIEWVPISSVRIS